MPSNTKAPTLLGPFYLGKASKTVPSVLSVDVTAAALDMQAAAVQVQT